MRYFRIFAIVAVTALSAWSVQAKDDPVQWGLSPAKASSGCSPAGPSGWSSRNRGTRLAPLFAHHAARRPYRLQDSGCPESGDIGCQNFRPQPVRKNDPNFQIDTETYSDKAVFLLEAQTAAGHTGPVDDRSHGLLSDMQRREMPAAGAQDREHCNRVRCRSLNIEVFASGRLCAGAGAGSLIQPVVLPRQHFRSRRVRLPRAALSTRSRISFRFC